MRRKKKGSDMISLHKTGYTMINLMIKLIEQNITNNQNKIALTDINSQILFHLNR